MRGKIFFLSIAFVLLAGTFVLVHDGREKLFAKASETAGVPPVPAAREFTPPPPAVVPPYRVALSKNWVLSVQDAGGKVLWQKSVDPRGETASLSVIFNEKICIATPYRVTFFAMKDGRELSSFSSNIWASDDPRKKYEKINLALFKTWMFTRSRILIPVIAENVRGLLWLRQADGTGPIDYFRWDTSEENVSIMPGGRSLYFHSKSGIEKYDGVSGKLLWQCTAPSGHSMELEKIAKNGIVIREYQLFKRPGIFLGLRPADGKVAWYEWESEKRRIRLSVPVDPSAFRPRIPLSLDRPFLVQSGGGPEEVFFINTGEESAYNVHARIYAYRSGAIYLTEDAQPPRYTTVKGSAFEEVPVGGYAEFGYGERTVPPLLTRRIVVFYSDVKHHHYQTEPYSLGQTGYEEERLGGNPNVFLSYVVFGNELWVGDVEHDRIAILDLNGKYRRSILLGKGTAPLYPLDIATDGRTILVVCNSGKVLRYNGTGKELASYDTQFKMGSIAAFPNGSFWIRGMLPTHYGEWACAMFDRNGIAIQGANKNKPLPGFALVGVDKEGTLYTLAENSVILRFDSDGKLLGKTTIPALHPQSVSLDRKGQFWVEDYNPNESKENRYSLKVISPEGKLLREIREFKGERNYEPCTSAVRLAFDADGSFWMRDCNNGYLFHITEEGKLLQVIGK